MARVSGLRSVAPLVVLALVAGCTGGGSNPGGSGRPTLGPVGDPVAEGVEYVIAAGTAAENRPVGLTLDARLVPIFRGWSRFAVGDFAAAPGCPTLLDGYVRGASSGFNSQSLFRLNGTELERLDDPGEAWQPTYGANCSLSVSIPERSRPLTVKVAWFSDMRARDPRPVVEVFDLRHLRSVLRQKAGPPLHGVMVGVRLEDGDFIAAITGRRRTVFMRVDPAGQARWIYARSGGNGYIWQAGRYLLLAKHDLIDPATGERIRRSMREIVAVRPDGSEALGIADHHTLLALKGPLFTQITRRISTPRPFPIVTWYEPWRLPKVDK